jgi:hypothetical protein
MERMMNVHEVILPAMSEKALQGAGPVRRERKCGVDRRRRERRPLPGMLLHVDGSRQQWFQDDRW